VTGPRDVLIEAGRLSAERRPYAFATVVRVERPASAREGNHAVITPEGDVVGWIGGACSGPTVVREALHALADGRPRLVAIEGSCASEGLVEVFIEPQLPEPVLAIVGESPAGQALADLAARIGWRVVRDVADGVDAVVVASLGTDDEAALRAALATPAGYVGLVASQRRGAATLATLREHGVDDEALARIRCPAGLDLGPSTQEEIAVAILAELVAWRHSSAVAETPASPADPSRLRSPAAISLRDPVCGMEVVIAEATETAEVAGVLYYFCGAGCRRRFEADPASYVPEVNRT
jgi:xanthine dehydrogenase accessory factor